MPKPEALDFVRAASLGVVAETACGALRALDVAPGDVLIVSAASGGVGSMAVQLAARAGAAVIGIAGERNLDYIRSLGATAVAYGEGLGAFFEITHLECFCSIFDVSFVAR